MWELSPRHGGFQSDWLPWERGQPGNTCCAKSVFIFASCFYPAAFAWFIFSSDGPAGLFKAGIVTWWVRSCWELTGQQPCWTEQGPLAARPVLCWLGWRSAVPPSRLKNILCDRTCDVVPLLRAALHLFPGVTCLRGLILWAVRKHCHFNLPHFCETIRQGLGSPCQNFASLLLPKRTGCWHLSDRVFSNPRAS